MADSTAHLAAEDWIRREWMPTQFGGRFGRERLKLSGGGNFDFDAVSADERCAAVISASTGKTASGRAALPKLMKIHSDILFLLMADLDRRLVIMSDEGLHKLCSAEIAKGRMPPGVEFWHAALPAELEERLNLARKVAADEVTPK